MSFTDPRLMWGLLLVPLLGLLAWRARRRAVARLARLVGPRAPHPLLGERDPAARRRAVTLALAALASLALGAAGPEWGREVVRRPASGSELVFVVDVSASMDSRDVPPSRLDEARREALAVLDRVEGSRVGVVAFAGDAVRLCPLTLDHGAARLTIESLTTGSVSEPGTDLGRALRLAARVTPGGRREEQAILLWTDGEDLEQGARGAIDELARSGIRVFVVGVGTAAGDVVPVLDDGGRVTDVKRDANGNAVRSRLDEELLRSLAQRTRGAYFSASRPGGELPRLLGAVAGLARGGRGLRLVERPVARFPLLAAVGALLLLLERLWAARRRRAGGEGAAALHSERGAAAAALALALLLGSAGRAAAQSPWARADRSFQAGRYATAESLYTLRLQHHAPDEVRVNRATAALLRARGPGDAATAAEEELRRLAAAGGRVSETAGYNLGTLLGGGGKLDSALATLRRVLEAHPEDADARWNYELLQRRKQQSSGGAKSSDRQQPKPSPGGPGGNQPQPGPGSNAPPGPQSPQGGAPEEQPRAPDGHGGMDRQQAERLLGALQDLERLDQQRRRQVRATRERKGRDW